MSIYSLIKNKEEKVSVIGLGYVGLPLAISFAKKVDVIGFDLSKEKVEQYLNGNDVTKEVGNEELQSSSAILTWDETNLKNAKFHIVAVPTPINPDKTPNLEPLINASKLLGRNLTENSIVVFESTVYPGVTEDICIPILEEESGLSSINDFRVGYSPERINPGDKKNTFETITKVVSGADEDTLEEIAKVYELVVKAGVHRAKSIKVAEAAKVIENSQRDINIAFMNELSVIFNKLDIDTNAVLEAAGSKWNFLNFSPGLVGGHCIGVDPYYLTYKAEEIGYHSQIILSGRRINDGMGKYVAENAVKKMIQSDKQIRGAKVAVLGIAFKENCPDSRNTKVIDIINELEEYGIEVQVVDPLADKAEVKKEYGIELCTLEEIKKVEAIIIATPHKEFSQLTLHGLKDLFNKDQENVFYDRKYTKKENMINFSNTSSESVTVLSDGNKNSEYILIDVKNIFNREEAEKEGYLYWSL